MAPLNSAIFEHQTPNANQLESMQHLRSAFNHVAATVNIQLPDGPDKTHVIRTLRTAAMWANVAVMKHPDGSPRRAIDDVIDYPPDHPVKGDLGSVPT